MRTVDDVRKMLADYKLMTRGATIYADRYVEDVQILLDALDAQSVRDFKDFESARSGAKK